jgi:hypothetical protein
VGRYHFNRMPAPRPRYLGDAWIHEGDSGPLLIALPPDARQALAVDLDRWRIAWSRPVSDQTVLRQDPAGIPWLIDLTTPTRNGDRSLQALALDPTTGRLIEPGSVRLEVPGGDRTRRGEGGRASTTAANLAPIIAGVPSLVGSWIAIPLEEGWGLWSREPLVGGPPERIIRWPEGSHGGTVIPAGDDRWLVIGRADAELGTRSAAVLMEGIRE